MEYFYIWSVEHNQWWGVQACGYVKDITRAGRYPRAKAIEICQQANFNGIDEIPVPVELMDHIW